MKIVTVLSLLFLASPVFGELTKEDLRTILKEEHTALEKRMKEYIDLKIDGVEKSLNAKIDATNTRIDGLDQRIDDMRIVMIALVGLIAAAVALPQIIIAYIERKREKEIHLLLQQLREKNGIPPSSS